MRDLWKSAKSTIFPETGNGFLHTGNGVHLVECTLKNKYVFILKTCGNVSVRERRLTNLNTLVPAGKNLVSSQVPEGQQVVFTLRRWSHYGTKARK